MSKAQEKPIGYTTKLTRDTVTFQKPDHASDPLAPGIEVEIYAHDKTSGDTAVIRATITEVKEDHASGRTTYSKTTPGWSTWVNRRERFPVYFSPKAQGNDKLRCQRTQPASIFHAILTCNTCNQEMKPGASEGLGNESQRLRSLHCPSCANSTISLRPTDSQGVFNGRLQCETCEKDLQEYRTKTTKDQVYLCPTCTENPTTAQPPILTVEPTNRYLTRMAVSTVLHNLQSILQAPDTEAQEDPRPTARMAEFLLSQINRRKQTLLAFSERPSFGYNDVRTRMEILLEQQAYLENIYQEATGTRFDWAACPASTDPDSTAAFINDLIETVTAGPERATIHYLVSVFTTAAPQRPTTKETVEFYIYG